LGGRNAWNGWMDGIDCYTTWIAVANRIAYGDARWILKWLANARAFAQDGYLRGVKGGEREIG